MNDLSTDASALDRASDLLKTGVPGLDDVLGGGLRLGERVLYVTLSESHEELEGVATSHGWKLDGIEVREMLPSTEALLPDEQHTIFHPSEVELGEASLFLFDESVATIRTRSEGMGGQSGVATPLIGGQHGPPLRQFQGVLTGVPVSLGGADAGPETPSMPCPNS